MLNKFSFLVLGIILILPLASAVDFESSHSDNVFAKGETLLVKVSGNFIDQITRENINFYRGHVQIPLEFDVKKFDNDFYIYALLPTINNGNYSVQIEDVRYYKATEIVDDNLVFNFTISNETADFSINPGIIVPDSDEFLVTLKNLKDGKTVISIDSSSNVQALNSIELNTGEEKTFTFSVSSEKGLETITFTSENTEYNLDAFFSESGSSSGSTGKSSVEKIEFSSDELEISMATGSKGKRVIYIYNTGSVDVEDVIISVSENLEPYVELSDYEIDEIESDSRYKIEISIESDSEDKIVDGFIFAEADPVSGNNTLEADLFLTLNFIQDFIPEEIPEEQKTLETCSELGGEICSSNYECPSESEIFKSGEGPCCLGSCTEIKTSSTGKWVGWSLIVLIILLVWWFYRKKYKRVR